MPEVHADEPGREPPGRLPQDGRLPDAVARYADHEDGVIDLFLPPPTGTPMPAGGTLVVLLHGGFWRTAYDRTHARPMAADLATRGHVVALPEYRRVGPGGAGGWPQTGQDVRDAMAALPDVLHGLALPAPGRTIVIGHSAGGHLALWLLSTRPAVDRVVALAPVCDVREAERRGLGSNAARGFFSEIDIDAADPQQLLPAEQDGLPDVVVVHGSSDQVVPVELSERFADQHPWARLVVVPGGHFEPIDPTATQYAAVLSALG